MEEKFSEHAQMFKALSDPNRLVILTLLIEGEVCACKILEQLKITQSTLSYHMKMLCGCELVECRRDGKWMHYSINVKRIKELREVLDMFSKRA